jgi:Icc-related predicted phosphoesterase
MKILAISDWHGKEKVLSHLALAIRGLNLDMIVFTGDILQWKAKCSEWANANKENRVPQKDLPEITEEIRRNSRLYLTFYETVRSLNLPFFSIPGNVDSPLDQYTRMGWEQMRANPRLHIVHCGFIVRAEFALNGFGGEVTEEGREDFFVLRFPRRELESGLTFPSGPPSARILLTHAPPVGTLDVDDGKHKGSKVINDALRKFKPQWLFCGHAHSARGTETIGECTAVNPGALKNGFYALVDTEKKQTELKNL